MHRIYLLLALVSAMVLTREARAAAPYEITSPKADFHITLAPHQSRMCVAWPAGRTDPVGCEGLDVSKFATIGSASQGITMDAVVLLREDDVMLLVMVMRDGSSFAKLDDRSLDEFAKGSMKGMQDKLPTVPMEIVKKQIFEKNGLQVGDVRVHATFAPDAPAAAIFTHSRYLQIPADGATFTLAFATGPKGLAKLDAVSDETLSTVSARKPKPKGLFDKDDDADSDKKSDSRPTSPAFREGEIIGRFIGFGLVGALVIGVIIAATRKRAAPQPWAGQQGFHPGNPPGGPSQGYVPQGQGAYQPPQQGYPPNQGYGPPGPPAAYPPNAPQQSYPPQPPQPGYAQQPSYPPPQQSYPPQGYGPPHGAPSYPPPGQAPASAPADPFGATSVADILGGPTPAATPPAQPMGQLPRPNPPPYDPSRGSRG